MIKYTFHPKINNSFKINDEYVLFSYIFLFFRIKIRDHRLMKDCINNLRYKKKENNNNNNNNNNNRKNNNNNNLKILTLIKNLSKMENYYNE